MILDISIYGVIPRRKPALDFNFLTNGAVSIGNSEPEAREGN
jgi:hypothetical protein